MTATSGTTTLIVPDGGKAVLISRGDGEFDLIGGSVNITNSINPLPVVNATSSNEAVALGQLTNGSLAPTFGPTVVSPATASNEAVNLGQLENGSVAASFASVNSGPLTTNNATVNGSITVNNGSGQTIIYVDDNVNDFVIRTGTTSSFNYSVVDASGNFKIGGYFEGSNATASNQAVMLGQSSAGAGVYNVTSSRALGTTYTNSNIRQLTLGVICNSTTTTGNLQAYVNGLLYSSAPQTASGISISVVAIVPPGATYEVVSSNGGAQLSSWIEEY
jgi:hypothetical protein